jgi:hypothetical protein
VNSLEKKCLSCINGARNYGVVQCLYQWHPGVIGGCGTEWVNYCHEYRRDPKGAKHLESLIVFDKTKGTS